MKKLIAVLVVVSMTLALVGTGYAHEGHEVVEEKKKDAPYFFVKSDDAGVDAFPLLRTQASVNIAGIIAEVELVQVYKNEGKKTIEAIYVFPLSTRAAIHKLKMKIGEREINAVIEEKKTAQAIYDKAKDDGKVATLLDQQRPNVFQMNVANIMPGDIVEVTVGYTELLVPESGVYEYVFPTVVGPRYNGESEKPEGEEGWISSSYSHEDKEPSYDFDIDVSLKTGIPINKVWTPSHDTEIEKTGDSARIRLSRDEKKSGNRDFVLRYKMEGSQIQTGLLLYPGVEENFFLLMARPPAKVTSRDIPPREYLFIVDVSGSMYGYPLDISKKVMRRILRKLREEDYFNILFFAGGSDVLSEYPLQATKENIKKAIEMLDGQDGGGGTNMLDAIEAAISLEKKEGLSRSVIIMTDGYVGVEKGVFDLVRERLSDANFFAFGIGTSVNRFLIEGIARAGMGESFVATERKEASKMADKFLEYVSSPLLTDIKVDFKGLKTYDVEPLNVPDLFANRPLIVYGKYKKAAGNIRITGKTRNGDYVRTIKVEPHLEDKQNVALKYLWARERIAALSDYGEAGDNVKEEVTELGLKYALMTAYTSFVAVDTVVRETGETVTVKQPLPLPEGVSDNALARSTSGGGGGYYPAVMACAKVAMSYEACDVGPSGYGGSSGYDASEDWGYSGYAEKKEAPSVYLTGGSFPKGVTMSQVERLLLPLKLKLRELFDKWGLKKIKVVLSVKKGNVVGIQVKSHEGRGYDESRLEKLLKGMTFSRSTSGMVELELGLF
ncbi:VIT domain-containing protein [Candidatus Omnitrophota bacterium]